MVKLGFAVSDDKRYRLGDWPRENVPKENVPEENVPKAGGVLHLRRVSQE